MLMNLLGLLLWTHPTPMQEVHLVTLSHILLLQQGAIRETISRGWLVVRPHSTKNPVKSITIQHNKRPTPSFCQTLILLPTLTSTVTHRTRMFLPTHLTLLVRFIERSALHWRRYQEPLGLNRRRAQLTSTLMQISWNISGVEHHCQ